VTSLLSGVCWRLKKDEVQWMSLALVDDRKAADLKNSAPITPRGMYFSSTPLPSLPSLLRRTWWDGVKEVVWRGRERVEGKPAEVYTLIHAVKNLLTHFLYVLPQKGKEARTL